MPRLPWRTIGVLIIASAAVTCGGDGPEPSPTGADVDEGVTDQVGRFIETRMQPGSAAFVIPSPIDRDESVDAVLEVSALETTPDEIQPDLEKELGRPTTGAAANIRLANQMLARLTTREPDAAVINNPEQSLAVPFDEPVRWTWSVTPILAGEIHFRAELLALVVIDGSNAAPFSVRSFDEVVTVEVSTANRARDMIGWLFSVQVITVVTALAGLCGWILNRRRRARSRRASDSPDD